MLPGILAPFFVIGLVGALARGRDTPAAVWCAAAFLLAIPVFALGGPNLKHCLALFPWVAALATFGLWRAHRAATPRWGERAASVAIGTVIVLFVFAEARHLLVTIPSNPRLAFRNGMAESTAEALAQNAEGRADAVLVATLGVDVAQLRVRTDASSQGTRPIEIRWFPDVWDASLARHLAAMPQALIVVQGEREPRFFVAAPQWRECYEKKRVKTGAFVSTVFVPTRPCDRTAKKS